jgi:MerR family transcriptional regulator/heat shock protein HspR
MMRRTGSTQNQKWMTYRKDDSGEEVCYVTLEGLARLTRLSMTSIRRLQNEGLIAPIEGEDQLFPQETLRRIAKIERLRNQLQVDLGGIEIILNLTERIESMEREIAALRERSRR